MNSHQPQTIAEVEALAAKVGLTLSPEDYDAAHRLAEQRQRQLESQVEHETQRRGLAALSEQFNRLYPCFIKSLHAVGDLLIVFVHSFLIAFGVPVVLVLSLIVEQQRITAGIRLFEPSPAVAGFASVVLVAVNLILELLIGWRRHLSGWQEPPRYEFSLRLVAIQARYMLGQDVNWQPAPKSPAQPFKVVLRLITVTILALAVAGSMEAVIQRNAGDWYAAIRQIVVHSTLIELFTWAGCRLFALTFVRVAQVLSSFVAQKVIEVAAIM